MAGQAWDRVFLQERLLVVVGSETRLFIWGFIPWWSTFTVTEDNSSFNNHYFSYVVLQFWTSAEHFYVHTHGSQGRIKPFFAGYISVISVLAI